MSCTTRITVLGAGNGGLAFAGYLAMQGAQVTLYNRTPAGLAAVRDKLQVRLTGKLQGLGDLHGATDDLATAVRDRQLLVVTMPATAHAPVLEALRGHLRPGQTVLLNPGGVGGWLCHHNDEAFAKGAMLAETSNLLYGCRKTADDAVEVTGIKNRVYLYGLPAALAVDMARWFPQFTASSSPLETGLNTTNVSVHCPILATHLDAIVAGQMQYFYRDGVDEASAELTERVEAERADLCRTAGVRMITMADLYHEAQGATLLELLRNRLAPSSIEAPRDLRHRFFAEDIPYGLIPMIDTANMLGIDVPAMQSMLDAFQGVRDWRAGARRIEAHHVQGMCPRTPLT